MALSNTAVAPRPAAAAAPQPVARGYGSSSFGPAAAAPVSPPSHFVPATNVTAAPVAPAHAPAVPAEDPAVMTKSSVSAPATSKPSKAPLFITLVGAVIFAGGVAGLFIYALSA